MTRDTTATDKTNHGIKGKLQVNKYKQTKMLPYYQPTCKTSQLEVANKYF